MLRNKKRFLLIILFLLIIPHNALGGVDAKFYRKAKKAAKKGNFDFAFMSCRNIRTEHPQSKYSERCLFAEGAYYFDLPLLKEASSLFREHIKNYPKSKARLFSLAYLAKIYQDENKKERFEEIRKKIINSKQLSFIFKNNEKYEYQSVFAHKYLAIFYIDKIEFYVEGQLLTKIIY